MTMSDSASSIVSFLGQQRKAEQSQPDASGRVYRAYGIDAPQKRPALMSIYYGDGRIGLMQKSFLTEILLTSHQHLSLIFTGCIITLEGQHLERLIDLLQDEKVLSLHCFNPKQHDRPPEGEIIILKIDRRAANDVLMKRKSEGV